jgi:hypothetical protein
MVPIPSASRRTVRLHLSGWWKQSSIRKASPPISRTAGGIATTQRLSILQVLSFFRAESPPCAAIARSMSSCRGSPLVDEFFLLAVAPVSWLALAKSRSAGVGSAHPTTRHRPESTQMYLHIALPVLLANGAPADTGLATTRRSIRAGRGLWQSWGRIDIDLRRSGRNWPQSPGCQPGDRCQDNHRLAENSRHPRADAWAHQVRWPPGSCGASGDGARKRRS